MHHKSKKIIRVFILCMPRFSSIQYKKYPFLEDCYLYFTQILLSLHRNLLIKRSYRFAIWKFLL